MVYKILFWICIACMHIYILRASGNVVRELMLLMVVFGLSLRKL